MTLNIQPTQKQYQAWLALNNPDIAEIHFGGGAGGGKAQPLTAKIVTPYGLKSMGDIKIGDNVCSPLGVSKVLAVYPQGKKKIFKITFQDGAQTRATEDHLWDCWISSRKGRRKIRTTSELIALKSKPIIPLAQSFFQEREIKIDPYVLGVMLGDGGLTKHLTLTSADAEIVKRLTGRLPKEIKIRKKGNIEYSVVADKRNDKGFPINPLAEKFANYGLLPIACGDRFIPEDYLFNSVEIRTEILKGLLDTDGYVDDRGHISFCSKSQKLAEGVQFLVRSLGGRATLSKIKKSCGDFIGDYLSVQIRIENAKRFFYLSKKRNRISDFNGGVSKIGRRIIKIEEDGFEEAQCIAVEGNLYLTDDFILTHNTWLGCESRLIRALAYPGYKSFIGRNELTRLMATSFLTFTKVCKHYGIPPSEWRLNGKYNYIDFRNGSRVDLLDLAYQPSDPMYERLGSLEYTDGGWIDEAGEVPFMAVDILQSRGGRHLNKEFNLMPDSLYTYNPNKGWVYRIYKQWKEGVLPKDVVFIQALYKDNPHTAEIYGKQLSRIKDVAMRARLKDGSFEYDSDPTSLIESDAILDLFTNTVDDGEKYMIIDVARHGVDKTVIYLFKGLKLYGVRIYAKQDTAITSEKSRNIAAQEAIPFSHSLADEDGIGGAVVDSNKGFKGFIANSIPFENPITKEKENYANLKAQCSYKLADKINRHEMAIDIKPEQFKSEVNGITYEVFKEMLIEELEAIKSKDKDKETKLKVISKEDVKESIGRSPDFSDTMMMRMWFEVALHTTPMNGISSYTPRLRELRRT